MTKSLLFVGNFLSGSTGIRSVCEDFSERLEAIGWRIIRTSRHPGRLLRMLDMALTTFSCRKKYACAVVEVYSGNAFIWAEAVCSILRLIRKPYILSLHGGGLADFTSRNAGRVARLLNGAVTVTTPSLFLQAALRNIRPDLRYLPNGLQLSLYPFRQSNRPAPNLTWLRGFHAIYNPMMAVRTVELLGRDFPDIHLTMYGPDKKDGSLSMVLAYIHEKGLKQLVSIPGAVPKLEVPNRLAKHKLFLNTTTLESFGVCVVEAAACGLPIVTTSVGELPYLWKDGEAALLVPDGNAEAMAAAVKRLLTEPGLPERLAANARHKAEQFDWAVILPQWEQLLESVLSASPTRQVDH